MTTPLAIVTGASRGIGRATALALAGTHEIAAVARSERELASLAEEIGRAGGRCRPIVLDVSDPDATTEALGGLEAAVLVNNAGVGTLKPLLDLSLDEWRTMVEVNFNGLFYVTRAVLPGMIRRGGGDVVTIGSLAGRNSFSGGTAYAGTKHAVMAFTESLMAEVRQQNVRVSVVMPGSVETAFGGRGGDTHQSEWKLQPEDVAAAVAYLIAQPDHAHVSRIEMRPARPPAK